MKTWTLKQVVSKSAGLLVGSLIAATPVLAQEGGRSDNNRRADEGRCCAMMDGGMMGGEHMQAVQEMQEHMQELQTLMEQVRLEPLCIVNLLQTNAPGLLVSKVKCSGESANFIHTPGSMT